jgi:hypothetical protein
VDPATYRSSLEGLAALLTPRTRVVAMPHVSNLLGGIEDVRAAAQMARAAGAELEGPNHFFIPKDAIPYKFELGGVAHGPARAEALPGVPRRRGRVRPGGRGAGVRRDGGAGGAAHGAAPELAG